MAAPQASLSCHYLPSEMNLAAPFQGSQSSRFTTHKASGVYFLTITRYMTRELASPGFRFDIHSGGSEAGVSDVCFVEDYIASRAKAAAFPSALSFNGRVRHSSKLTCFD